MSALLDIYLSRELFSAHPLFFLKNQVPKFQNNPDAITMTFVHSKFVYRNDFMTKFSFHLSMKRYKSEMQYSFLMRKQKCKSPFFSANNSAIQY